MKFLLPLLLLFAAHFSLTAFAPAEKAWIGWPFAANSKPWLGFIGGLPSQPGSIVTPVLAGLAGLGFLAAAVGLFWSGIPANLLPALVTGAAAASGLLYILYIGPWAVLPLLLDALLVWGVLGWQWTSAALRGG